MGGSVKRRDVMVGVVATAAALPFGAGAIAGLATHEVRIKGFAFVPARISVKVGNTIRWTNDDLAPHTATADDLEWDSGELARNQSAEIVVTAEMETAYFCVFHPHMTGYLVVT